MTDLLQRPPRAVASPAPRPTRTKPPLVLRVAAGLLAALAAAFAGALMLSDRAPGVVRALFGDAGRRLWERMDASGRAEFVTSTSAPESDQLVHIAVWAIVTVLVGIAVWSWSGLAVGGVVIGFASAVVESGQGTWSQTRTVETGDLIANGVGVALGVMAVAVLYLAWAAAVLVVRGIASGIRPQH